MSAGIAVTTLVVISVAFARLVKDLLIVRLLRTLIRDSALSQAQRFEICARLASALRPDAESPDRSALPRTRPSARPEKE